MEDNKSCGLELLKSIREISQMITDLEEEITKTYTILTSTTIKPKGVDVQTSLPQDPMGDRVASIIEYQQMIEKYQQELCEKKNEVLKTMKCLEVIDQQILLYKYFRGMSIEQISDKIEKSYYWTWQLLHKAEDNFCIKFKLVDRS